MATVETKLVEEISSELLLAKAENTQLLEIIATKDSVIHKLTQESKTQKLRIRAQRVINRNLVIEKKELQEKFARVQDYFNEPVVKKIMREIKEK